MRVPVTVELTQREMDFVFALAHGLKPTRAATTAGYAVSSAKLLLRKPHVVAAIKAVHRNTQAVVEKIERQEDRRAGR